MTTVDKLQSTVTGSTVVTVTEAGESVIASHPQLDDMSEGNIVTVKSTGSDQSSVVAVENSSPEVIHVVSVTSSPPTQTTGSAPQVVTLSGLPGGSITISGGSLTFPVTIPVVGHKQY